MTFLDWVAAVILGIHLPIPLFWLIVHPLVSFWRRHVRLAYLVAGLSAWGSVGVLLVSLRRWLFVAENAATWEILVGFALLAASGYIFYHVERELGTRRLIGQMELKGSGELATRGIYARMRHPRYAGMMLAVVGCCLIAGSLLLWVIAAAWSSLAFLATLLEERELRTRFGAAYDEYCKRVPRFLPFRRRSRDAAAGPTGA